MPSVMESIEILKSLIQSDRDFPEKARECKYEADLVWNVAKSVEVSSEEKGELDQIGKTAFIGEKRKCPMEDKDCEDTLNREIKEDNRQRDTVLRITVNSRELDVFYHRCCIVELIRDAECEWQIPRSDCTK